jgi:hypothetical protein
MIRLSFYPHFMHFMAMSFPSARPVPGQAWSRCPAKLSRRHVRTTRVIGMRDVGDPAEDQHERLLLGEWGRRAGEIFSETE